MEEPSGQGLTPKARRTRERILEAALALFADRGYEATTMRDVAREAGASLGLAYRYFASKEEFALALYMRLAEESEDWARDGLAGGTVAERFERAMLVKLDQVSSHRGPLAALLARDPRPQLPALRARRGHRRRAREDGRRLPGGRPGRERRSRREAGERARQCPLRAAPRHPAVLVPRQNTRGRAPPGIS